ncbi:MAG: DUF6432 family protein [Halobacteriales archaeon]|nr:DUF6432 family protein [Halobacteriales archaeon]
MRTKRRYRGREEVQVAVLDALVDRREDGMTVFELRTSVDADIDTLEEALAGLKEDELITVTKVGSGMVIKPDDEVVPEPGENEAKPSLIEELRRRLPF